LAEAIAVGNRRLECILLNRLSWVPTSRNDFVLAARYSEQALALSREIGDRMTEANALTNMGNAYIQLTDFARGDIYSQQALELYRQLGDPGGEGAVLDNLGNSAWASGHYEKALRYKQEALEISRRIGDRQTETNILGNLGIVASDMGDNTAALEYLTQALALTHADGNRSIESTIAAHLARVCLQSGDVQAAYAYARHAHTAAQALNAPRDTIDALNVWGSAELALGHASDALELHRQEEGLAIEAGLADYAAGARARQASALLALGDLAGAVQCIQLVLETQEQWANSVNYAPADIFLACVRVLLQAEDPRADQVLARAHDWLQQHLARLNDEMRRHAFIEHIPAHAALMQVWEARHVTGSLTGHVTGHISAAA
jgi:tetratricopeptide (TPR) repeat protein